MEEEEGAVVLGETILHRLDRSGDNDLCGVTGAVTKKRRQRNKGREKANGKKLVFYAAFQTVDISQGVHTDTGTDITLDHENTDHTKTDVVECNSEGKTSLEVTSEELLISESDDSFDDDLDLYYEEFDYCNRKGNGTLSPSSSRSTSGSQTAKQNQSHIPGLMKIVGHNKAVRKESNVSRNQSAQKENIDKKLDKRGLKKFGYDIYQRRADASSSTRQTKKHSPQTRKTCSASHTRGRHQREDHPAALKYELKSNNIPDGATGAHMDKIIDLQHRDLTPEDYELLLMLDESIAPKTVSENLLRSLAVMTVESAEAIGELCSICMEIYHASQTVKKLPCAHVFHEQCIDMWLSNSSLNCPLDGLAVEVT